MPLTNRFIKAAFLAICVAGAGPFTSALAGPEPIQDNSKDKAIQEIAPVCDPRWYISIGGDAEINFGGNHFNKGADRDFSFGNLGTASVDIDSHDYNDVYNNPFYSIEAEFGYVLTRHIELFSTFRYVGSTGSDRTDGSSVTINLLRNINGTFPLHSDFGDFHSYGGEVGIRYFFLPKESRLRPYISLSGGVSHVDSINVTTRADFSSVGGPSNTVIFKGGFFDDTWVGTGSALLGLEYRVTCHWTLGMNAGVRYQSELDDNDRDLSRISNPGGVDLSFLKGLNNNAGDRWSAPVTGYVKFRF
jgi:hypothetical protein